MHSVDTRWEPCWAIHAVLFLAVQFTLDLLRASAGNPVCCRGMLEFAAPADMLTTANHFYGDRANASQYDLCVDFLVTSCGQPFCRRAVAGRATLSARALAQSRVLYRRVSEWRLTRVLVSWFWRT